MTDRTGLTNEQIDDAFDAEGFYGRNDDCRRVARRIEALVRKECKEKCDEAIREVVRKMRGDGEGDDASKQAVEPCTEEGCRKHHYLHHDASRKRRG